MGWIAGERTTPARYGFNLVDKVIPDGATKKFLGRQRIDADFFSGTPEAFKCHNPVGLGEQSVVFAHPHVVAGVDLGSQLPDQDVSCRDLLPTKTLDAPPLALAIPSVS